MRKFFEVVIEVLTWLLFGVATFLLARQTYFAIQGEMPDYANSQGALIVAGIVTLTWLAMLGRIVLHLDKTVVDWVISLSLLVSGIAVDVAVALSFVFEWQFPTHLALLVIVAHVVAHVAQWVVSAGQVSFRRFGGAYKTPEQELAEKLAEEQQRRAEEEHRRAEVELRWSNAQAELDHIKAEQGRTYGAACDVPGCGWTCKGKTQREVGRVRAEGARRSSTWEPSSLSYGLSPRMDKEKIACIMIQGARMADTDFTLNILLGRIKDEADRLLAAESGLDRETAYQRAIASVVMVAAEEQAVTPFEARLLERLGQAARRNGGRPVSTKLLMVELGVDTWNIWYHLRRLEERGLVHRPEGPKSGWAVAA